MWDELPETIVCARPFYERLSSYLVHKYVIPSGKMKNAGFPLAELSARNYLGTAINRAGNKFHAGGSVATKDFCFCLDTKSSSEVGGVAAEAQKEDDAHDLRTREGERRGAGQL